MTASDTAQMPLSPKVTPGLSKKTHDQAWAWSRTLSYECHRAKAAGPHDGTTLSRIEDVSTKLARSQPISHSLSTTPHNLSDSPVSALRAVKQIHLLLLLRSRSAHVTLVGVRLGVHDAGGLAESRHADAMPETDLQVRRVRTIASL
jgi:hypothetical protein